MHVVKMIMTVFGLVYFAATIWNVSISYIYTHNKDGYHCFWKTYNLDKLDSKKEFILSFYFAFSTLYSVGFGDIVP
jgi:hypothetical protein